MGEAFLMSTHNTTYVSMENCIKLSFNYHQIPILSVLLHTEQEILLD